MSGACDDWKRAIIFYPLSTMWFGALKKTGRKTIKARKRD
jgi:hypothetical protein